MNLPAETPEARSRRVLAEYERVAASPHVFDAAHHLAVAADLDGLAVAIPFFARKYTDRADDCRGHAVRASLRAFGGAS